MTETQWLERWRKRALAARTAAEARRLLRELAEAENAGKLARAPRLLVWQVLMEAEALTYMSKMTKV